MQGFDSVKGDPEETAHYQCGDARVRHGDNLPISARHAQLGAVLLL